MLSYFEGKANLYSYTSCTLIKLHALKCHIFNVVSWKDVIKYLQKREACTHFSEIVYVLSSKYPANKTLRNTENKHFHVNVCQLFLQQILLKRQRSRALRCCLKYIGNFAELKMKIYSHTPVLPLSVLRDAHMVSIWWSYVASFSTYHIQKIFRKL